MNRMPCYYELRYYRLVYLTASTRDELNAISSITDWKRVTTEHETCKRVPITKEPYHRNGGTSIVSNLAIAERPPCSDERYAIFKCLTQEIKDNRGGRPF
ncbi:hypothetical protein M513_06717 [Trichuris suis]|uniref:Uncharacterized protein n=1 Tax=Trichuris suis TaxID=68888 RepID=A0A085M540_9BILA|nr:hypothetical protein M513_06717 [Trichuris suis]